MRLFWCFFTIGCFFLCTSFSKSDSNYQTNCDVIIRDSIWYNVDVKVNWFKEGAVGFRDLSKVPSDFKSFYLNFISDSLSQIKRLDFEKLLGVMGECDTTIYLDKQNWKYTSWNFLDFFDLQNNPDSNDDDTWNNTFYYSRSKFFYEFRINGAGTIYQVGFECIDNDWKLTLYYVNNC